MSVITIEYLILVHTSKSCTYLAQDEMELVFENEKTGKHRREIFKMNDPKLSERVFRLKPHQPVELPPKDAA